MKVNFLLIGAGRSGTTSFVEYMKQHPSIEFSKIKEVPYFSFQSHLKKGIKYFHSFFVDSSKPLLATSDTYLLINNVAPKKVKEYNSLMKIGIILREPGERSYSSFQYAKLQGYQPQELSFLESEKLENKYLNDGTDIVIKNNYAHFDGSLYSKHIEQWLKKFERSQLFITTTKQLKNNPEDVFKRLFTFLEISPFHIQIITPKNKAVKPKSKLLNLILVDRNHWLRKLLRKPLQIGILHDFLIKSGLIEQLKSYNSKEYNYQPMTEEERYFCTEYFADEKTRLKELVGIEF